jgi:hypothetical protein
VIFESANCSSFSSIVAMETRGSKLEAYVFFNHAGSEELGVFNVEFLQFGLQSACFEELDGVLIGREVFLLAHAFHGFNLDEITIILVEDEHDVLLSAGGWDNESPCGIRVDLASGTLAVDV